jgi:hypothetical protein
MCGYILPHEIPFQMQILHASAWKKIATQHNIIYTVRAENRRKVVIYKSQKSRIVTQEMRRSRLSAHREEAKKRQRQNNMLAH